MSLARIAAAAVRECERQHVGERALIGLLSAHAHAIENDGPITEELLRHWAELIEPGTRGQYRRVPVTFSSGGWAAPAAELPGVMSRWVAAVESRASRGLAEWQVKAFLDAHPFEDGNGRLAWLLLNVMLGTLKEPVELPDFYGQLPHSIE